MPHAEKCPVCNGVGTVPGNKPCHGCKGAGWVTVPGESQKLQESEEDCLKKWDEFFAPKKWGRYPPSWPWSPLWPYDTRPRSPWEPYIVWGITTTDCTARPGPAWTASVPA